MYARVLEMKTKRGQARGLSNAIEREVKPIVEKYHGFIEGFVLIPDEAPDTLMTISFWQDKAAAEKFRVDGYPKVAPIYERFTDGGIHVKNCDVTLVPSFTKARAAKAS